MNTPPRELTLDEAVAFAILLQKNGQLAEAGEVYRRVLDTEPEHARALHYAGVLAHQQGRRADAIALVERSLALEPQRADWHSNLGIVLQSDGRLERAVEAYQRAIAIDPTNRGLKFRRVAALFNAKEYERAAALAAEAQTQHADDPRFPRIRARALFERGQVQYVIH